MRILIAIDKFKGSIPATVAAQAIATALQQTLPEVTCAPSLTGEKEPLRPSSPP